MLLRISRGRLRKHNGSEISDAGTGLRWGCGMNLVKIDMKIPILPPVALFTLEPRRVEQDEKLGLKMVKGNGQHQRREC